MSEKQLSASDVTKICEGVFRNIADRARRNNSFYKMSYNKFVNISNPKWKDNEDVVNESNNKNVYISTLSLTNLIKNYSLCGTLDDTKKKIGDRNCLQILEPIAISDIVYNRNTYVHKTLYPKETFISDPFVDNFYIKKDNNNKHNNNNDDLQVLFSIKVGLQFKNKGMRMQTFYIVSNVSASGIKNKLYSWFTWKSQKDIKMKQSTYESLINNMTDIVFADSVYNNVNDEVDYYSISKDDFPYLKQGMLERQFTNVPNEVEDSFRNYSIYMEDPSVIKIVGDEVKTISTKKVSFHVVNNDRMTESFDKEAFFTFDIRDSDFQEVMAMPTTVSSIRKEEYNQLKLYQKDPSTYVKQKK